MNTMYEIRTKNAKYEFSDGELVSGILIAVVCLTLMNALLKIKRRMRMYGIRINLSRIESSVVAIFMVHMGLWLIGGQWIFKEVNLDCRMNAFAMPLIAITLIGLTLFLRRLRTRPQDIQIEIEEDDFLLIVQVSFNMINVFQLLAWMASYVYKDGVLLGILAVVLLAVVLLAGELLGILAVMDPDDESSESDGSDESSGSDGSDVSEDQSNGSDNWSDASDED